MKEELNKTKKTKEETKVEKEVLKSYVFQLVDGSYMTVQAPSEYEAARLAREAIYFS